MSAIFLSAIFLCCGQRALGQDLLSIGILDIVAGERISLEETEYLTGLLYDRALFYGADNYKLIDREIVVRALLENQLGMPNTCSESMCACSAGALLSADYIIIGNLRVGKKYLGSRVDYRLLQLEKVNIDTKESEFSLKISTKIRAKPKRMEKQLKHKSKALFCSYEERQRYYQSKLVAARVSGALGYPLLFGGLCLVGLGSIGRYGWFALEDFHEGHQILGACSVGVGSILVPISLISSRKAKFWKSTLLDK